MYSQRKHRALLEEAQAQPTVTKTQPTFTSLVSTPTYCQYNGYILHINLLPMTVTFWDFMVILMPFESAIGTHCVQGDRVMTGSMVLPCVHILKAELEELYSKYTFKFVLIK